MNTKNIFRMLLVAALLLVGANGAKAAEIVLWESATPVAVNYNTLSFDQSKVMNLAEGDILKFQGSVTNPNEGQRVLALYTGNNNFIIGTNYEWQKDPFVNGVASYTFTAIQAVTCADTNYPPVIYCINMSLTKVWIETSSEEGNNGEGNNTGEEEETLTYEGTLLWSGNEDLGDWSNNVSIPLGTFDNIKVGDELRFYGKLNDTTNPAYQFKLYGGQWGDLTHIVSSDFDGYVSVPVTAEILAGLTMADHWGYSGYFNGTNLTIKAITRVIPKEYVGLTIGATGYATFSSTKALNLNSAKNLKFYYAKTIDTQAAQVTMVQALGTVAANTGLVVVGSPAENIKIEVAEEGTTYNDNLLVAVSNDNTQVQGAGKYVLTYKNNTVMFAETTGAAATVNAGQAYLKGAAAAARGARMAIVFNGEATAIQSMTTAAEPASNAVYNLRGQRVMNPGKGLYIINGKKVIK